MKCRIVTHEDGDAIRLWVVFPLGGSFESNWLPNEQENYSCLMVAKKAFMESSREVTNGEQNLMVNFLLSHFATKVYHGVETPTLKEIYLQIKEVLG